jgi:Tfp pilus assembly protein PilX
MMNKYPVLQPSIAKHQAGVVLVISLIMLLALTLIGVTSSNVTGLEEKMAANSKDVNLAFQAAEAALRAAETSLNTQPTSTTKPTRTAVIANQGVGGGAGYYTLLMDNAVIVNGIQTTDPTPITPAQTPAFYSGYSSSCTHCVNWGGGTSINSNSLVNYLVYGGTNLSGLAQTPEYIIEELANTGGSGSTTGGGTSLGGGSDKSQNQTTGNTITFRLTAHGWGSNANSVATVQSIVKASY